MAEKAIRPFVSFCLCHKPPGDRSGGPPTYTFAMIAQTNRFLPVFFGLWLENLFGMNGLRLSYLRRPFPLFYTWRKKARREWGGTPRVTWQHAFGRHRVASYNLVIPPRLVAAQAVTFCEEVSSQSGFSFTTRFRSVHRDCCLQARRQSRPKSSDFPPRPSPHPLSMKQLIQSLHS